MPDLNEVVGAARQLNDQNKDDDALILLIGMRAAAIEQNPALGDNIRIELKYETEIMGPLDDVKRLGLRVTKRWNKELHGIVCGTSSQDTKERKEILDSLNLGEAAIVAAVASVLLSLGLAAALTAPLALLIVRRFIWPAKDELCAAWSEAITDQG